MKIAIIGHKRIPSNEGGIEKGVEQHAVRMVKRGHGVTAYNRGGHNSMMYVASGFALAWGAAIRGFLA